MSVHFWYTFWILSLVLMLLACLWVGTTSTSTSKTTELKRELALLTSLNLNLNSTDPIQHIVILMLENRSFDQVLGGLANVNGVKANSHFNLDTQGQKIFTQPIAALADVTETADFPHQQWAVAQQLANNNGGFVTALEKHDQYLKAPASSEASRKQQVMSFYQSGALPVTHTLASAFTVCDQWFSSFPGPTIPNRLFFMSGSSSGLEETPTTVEELQKYLPALQAQPTLFTALNDKNVDWKVYYSDVSSTLLSPRSWTVDCLRNHYNFQQFLADTSVSNTGVGLGLPSVSWIEPAYIGASATDGHPTHSLANSERLVGQVYNALRANEALWQRSLLLVVFDEHGGFYDHVPVQPAVDPTNSSPGPSSGPALATSSTSTSTSTNNPFTTTGVRVPALLISPWLAKSAVDSTPRQHTSMLKYLQQKFGLSSFGPRVATSNSMLNPQMLLSQPRTDTPQQVTLPPAIVNPPSLSAVAATAQEENAVITVVRTLTNMSRSVLGAPLVTAAVALGLDSLDVAANVEALVQQAKAL